MINNPIPIRAVKVQGGKITHALSEHGEATAPRTTAVGVDAPDGTYLRLDYVLEVLRDLADQVNLDSSSYRVLESLGGYFELREL